MAEQTDHQIGDTSYRGNHSLKFRIIIPGHETEHLFQVKHRDTK